jgi:hypothetical protein
LKEKLKALKIRIEIDGQKVVDSLLSLMARLLKWVANRIHTSAKSAIKDLYKVINALEAEIRGRITSPDGVWDIGSVHLSVLRNGLNKA